MSPRLSGPDPAPVILLINGSRKSRGNTAFLLRCAKGILKDGGAKPTTINLASAETSAVIEEIKKSDGLIVGTGTYWDSWSSNLQRFLEEATEWEDDKEVWLGKPVAVLVTEHSVGGKGILSRLQGVFVTLGCAIPPMSGFVYSLVGQNTALCGLSGANDTWQLGDLKTVCANLIKEARRSADDSVPFKQWSTAKKSPGNWIKCSL